jgi:hypothetical protein
MQWLVVSLPNDSFIDRMFFLKFNMDYGDLRSYLED